ncbi:MAG: OpgC domain-containing protein [Verrucomicrobiales bacterium]
MNLLQASRYSAIDALRGGFMAAIVLAHMGVFISRITFETVGWLTAAEGFVFLSGLVGGLVLGRKSERGSIGRLCLARVGKLYLSHITVFVIVLLLVNFSDGLAEHWSTRFASMGDLRYPGKVLMPGLLLLFQPDLLNILPLYIVFLMIAPMVIGGFQRNLDRTVLAISVAVWFVGQAMPDLLTGTPGAYLGVATFNVLGWQFLDVRGMWIGYCGMHRGELLVQPTRGKVVLALLIASLGLVSRNLPRFADMVAISPNFPQVTGEYVAALTNRSTLGVARILNFAALAFLFFVALGDTVWLPAKLRRGISWPCRALKWLGRRSLQAFTAHIPVCMVAGYFVSAFAIAHPDLPFVAKVVFQLGVYALSLIIIAALVWCWGAGSGFLAQQRSAPLKNDGASAPENAVP